jgi:hypothetical protein
MEERFYSFHVFPKTTFHWQSSRQIGRTRWVKRYISYHLYAWQIWS